MESARRRDVRTSMNLPAEEVKYETSIAVHKEERRKLKKELKKLRIETSVSYSIVKGISKAMDDYFLDPIIGLIPGLGDILSSLFVVPYIYVSLFKVRSIPLTLAVISNVLVDLMIGMLPYVGWVGDIFYRSFRKNTTLITGYVEDDKEIIKKVERRAFWSIIVIAIVSYLIYLLVGLVVDSIQWVLGLFS